MHTQRRPYVVLTIIDRYILAVFPLFSKPYPQFYQIGALSVYNLAYIPYALSYR